jgi:site-specific recombinase XerD
MSNRTLSRKPVDAPGQLSLFDLLHKITADDTIAPRRRQDVLSALRTLARVLGKPLAECPAHPGFLADRLKGFSPASANLSPGRWSNTLSLTRFALKQAGVLTVPGRYREPLKPAWAALLAPVRQPRICYGLSRFARYCGANGVDPLDVNDAQMTQFLEDLSEAGLTNSPRNIHRMTCWLWNKAVPTIPGWPQRVLTVPDYRKHYALPWHAFPASLKADVDAYLDRLAGKDVLAEGYFRPLRPTSIENRLKLLRAFASALVHHGYDPHSLKMLSDLVPVDVLKHGLRVVLDRADGKKTAYVHEVAYVLTAVAQYWVEVEPQHLQQLKELCKRLNPRRGGMTEKNRQRLRQFDDPENVGALLALPAKLLMEARRADEPTIETARKVQTAVALELLLMIPMRLKNLAEIEIDRHIVRSHRGPVHLTIPGYEVKNGTDLEAALPQSAVRLMDSYIRGYRPLLLDGPSVALFPGKTGISKTLQAMRLQIMKAVERHCGLHANPHLFRHIAAKLYLDANPGAYGVVRLLLGHKSIETTIKFYCGTETAAAYRHFDAHVLKLREGTALPSNAMPGRRP